MLNSKHVTNCIGFLGPRLKTPQTAIVFLLAVGDHFASVSFVSSVRVRKLLYGCYFFYHTVADVRLCCVTSIYAAQKQLHCVLCEVCYAV